MGSRQSVVEEPHGEKFVILKSLCFLRLSRHFCRSQQLIPDARLKSSVSTPCKTPTTYPMLCLIKVTDQINMLC